MIIIDHPVQEHVYTPTFVQTMKINTYIKFDTYFLFRAFHEQCDWCDLGPPINET